MFLSSIRFAVMGGINTTGIILSLSNSGTPTLFKKWSNQTRGILSPGAPILWSCQCGPTKNVPVVLSSASVDIAICVLYVVWVADGICGTKSYDVLWM